MCCEPLVKSKNINNVRAAEPPIVLKPQPLVVAHFPAEVCTVRTYVAEIGRHDTEGGMLQGDTYGAQFAFKDLMIH